MESDTNNTGEVLTPVPGEFAVEDPHPTPEEIEAAEEVPVYEGIGPIILTDSERLS